MRNSVIVIDSDSGAESDGMVRDHTLAGDHDDINIIGENRNIVYLVDDNTVDNNNNNNNSHITNRTRNSRTNRRSQNNTRIDDDITILEERTGRTVPLMLPGNNTMEINITNNELPNHSSFTNLSSLQNIINTFPPVIKSLFRDSVSVTRFRTNLDQLPINIINSCNRSRNELISLFKDYIRIRTNRNRQFRRNNTDTVTNTHNNNRRNLERRRNLFHYDEDEDYLDENINDIPHMRRLRRTNRVNFGGSEYSHIHGIMEAYARLDSGDTDEEDFHDNIATEYFQILGAINGTPIPNNNNFINNNANNSENMNPFNDFFHGYNHWRNNEQQSTQNIINIIQQREEREKDIKIKELTNKNKILEETLIHEAKNLPKGYSSNFIDNNNDNEPINETEDSNNKGSEYDVPICNLCGVELGVGIPNEFLGISIDDKNLLFDDLVIKYNSPCPYQSLTKPSQLERDLSKRTFISKCGHVFCGRCFTRISNAKGQKLSKKILSELKGPSNPNNYGPRFCPATDCKAIIRAKGKLKEIYF